MLLNLKTIHTPETLEEATALLHQPGAYPLYGSGALLRHPRPDVEIGVRLDRLGLDYVRDSENSLRMGCMLTLEQVRLAYLERGKAHPCLGGIAEALALDFPETLRHTLTLGDLLVERDPQSMTLTLLLALGGVLKRLDADIHLTLTSWLSASNQTARYLIGQVRLVFGPTAAAVALEKVARTPADAPIVGAAAVAQVGSGGQMHTTLALCGVAATPIPQPETAQILDQTGDMDAALAALVLDPPDDHWGSREYRSEMAHIVSRRALTRAVEAARARAAG